MVDFAKITGTTASDNEITWLPGLGKVVDDASTKCKTTKLDKSTFVSEWKIAFKTLVINSKITLSDGYQISFGSSDTNVDQHEAYKFSNLEPL